MKVRILIVMVALLSAGAWSPAQELPDSKRGIAEEAGGAGEEAPAAPLHLDLAGVLE